MMLQRSLLSLLKDVYQHHLSRLASTPILWQVRTASLQDHRTVDLTIFQHPTLLHTVSLVRSLLYSFDHNSGSTGRSSKRRPSEIITSNPPRVRDHSLPTGGTPTISPYVPRFTYATTNPHGAAPPPSSNGNPAPPTFWIPFTLAPGAVPGSMARLTPINRRVPAHLRAAASALNLKMMYPLQSGTNPFAMDRPTQPAPAPAAVPAATSSRSRESKSRNDAATASGGGSGGVTSTSRPADPSFNFESSRTRKSKLEVSSTIDGKDRRQRSSASSPLPQAEVESRPEPPREKETVVERAPSPKVEIQETVVDDVVDKAAETEVVVEAIEDCGKESEVTEVGHVDPNFQIVVDPILVPVEIEHTEAEGVHTILVSPKSIVNFCDLFLVVSGVYFLGLQSLYLFLIFQEPKTWTFGS